MSRTAQDVLEFDKLRELLRLRTTCAPGRRAVNGLQPGWERPALESAFALIREAAERLRSFPCWRHRPLRLVIFEMCKRRFGVACCRTARSTMTHRRRCGESEQASWRRARRSRRI